MTPIFTLFRFSSKFIVFLWFYPIFSQAIQIPTFNNNFIPDITSCLELRGFYQENQCVSNSISVSLKEYLDFVSEDISEIILESYGGFLINYHSVYINNLLVSSASSIPSGIQHVDSLGFKAGLSFSFVLSSGVQTFTSLPNNSPFRTLFSPFLYNIDLNLLLGITFLNKWNLQVAITLPNKNIIQPSTQSGNSTRLITEKLGTRIRASYRFFSAKKFTPGLSLSINGAYIQSNINWIEESPSFNSITLLNEVQNKFGRIDNGSIQSINNYSIATYLSSGIVGSGAKIWFHIPFVSPFLGLEADIAISTITTTISNNLESIFTGMLQELESENEYYFNVNRENIINAIQTNNKTNFEVMINFGFDINFSYFSFIVEGRYNFITASASATLSSNIYF